MSKNSKQNLQELESENKKLKAKNESLNSKLVEHENRKKVKRKLNYWIARKVSNIFIGKDLNSSLKESIDEFNLTKKISSKNISNVTANIIWRITRIGFFAILSALVPSYFLFRQNHYLELQNSKIDAQNDLIQNQNKRLDQQTNLQEANRRSSLVFLTSDIMNSIDAELKDSSNITERNLSPQLIGRIVSLSRSLKPYRYLKNDSLTQLISPERSQLLLSLVNAKLSNSTYSNIFTRGDFSYSEINDYKFENIDFGNVNFDNSIFERVKFENCNFSSIVLTKVYGKDISFEYCDFDAAVIENSKFDRLDFFSCFFSEYIDFISSNANEFRIEDSSARAITFTNSEFSNFSFLNNYITYFKGVHNKNRKHDTKLNIIDSYFMHFAGNENFLDNFKLNLQSKFYKFYLNELSDEKSRINYFDLNEYSIKIDESPSNRIFISNDLTKPNTIKESLSKNNYFSSITKKRMLDKSSLLINNYVELHKNKN